MPGRALQNAGCSTVSSIDRFTSELIHASSEMPCPAGQQCVVRGCCEPCAEGSTGPAPLGLTNYHAAACLVGPAPLLASIPIKTQHCYMILMMPSDI